MSAEPLTSEIVELLAIAGLDFRATRVSSCGIGGNNRVFVVETGDKKLVAKWYFSHPVDTRNRLRSEFEFLTYARQIGITCVPEPITCDPERHIALYEFVSGRKLLPGEVEASHIRQAINFFDELNREQHHSAAEHLMNASEACFSIADHFSLVDQRISRLSGISGGTTIDVEAAKFVSALSAAWHETKSHILREVSKAGLDPCAVLPEQERCISPSDFGFHNALTDESGGVHFIDFEYAGWDDPAKMVADFFCHPAVPIGPEYFDNFLDATMHFSKRPDALAARARLLFSVFQTKWCCIILNDFLPDSARRRRFADPTFDEAQRKEMQLDKAQKLLSTIQY